LSKFKNTLVIGNGSQFGDNNTQNNIENHHHHGENNSKKTDDAIPIFFVSIIAFAAAVWWFFLHIEQVFYYLNIVSISSMGFSFLSIPILALKNEISWKDGVRFITSVIFAIALFCFAIMARNYAPDDIIQLSQQVSARGFWSQLNEHGQNIAFCNFLSAFCVALASIFNHFGSLRQFIYSVSNSEGKGFFFNVYQSMSFFNMQTVSICVILSCGITWAALHGYLPHFPH
jgi:hypothetical protein